MTPSTIGDFNFARALCDLGATTNMLLHIVFRLLGLGAPKPTLIRLLMVDRAIQKVCKSFV